MGSKKKLYVHKATGEFEPFSPQKLKHSMKVSGASTRAINEVISEIKSRVKDGMSTSQIYALAFQMLRKRSKIQAARYSLKRAIMQLGPDGFPFEQYVAALLRDRGYIVRTNQILQGYCIVHEVDVVAEKSAKNVHAFIEAKFHSAPGNKTDTKDALYTFARFLDLEKQWVAKRTSGALPKSGEIQAWLVTNTSVTTEAIKYARCNSMKIVSWDFPERDNLQSWIQNRCLYPVTVLLTLSHRQKKILLQHDCVLCKDVLGNTKALEDLHLSKSKYAELNKEIGELCSR